MKTLEEIANDIQTSVQGSTAAVEGSAVIVGKEKWQDVARFLKNNSAYAFDYLSCVTGTDYKDRLEAVYHLYSIEKRQGPLAIKVRTDRDKSEIPSVTPVWKSAEFQEREAYDLLGLQFTGHPDLRRILMWDGFKFHPLRKDYVQEDQDKLGD